NVSPGQYSLSFFYRTTSANVASVAASVAFFSTDTCANAVGSVVTNDSSPDLSGAWSQTSSFGEAPASARSMQLTVDFICTNGCAGTPVVNYDDVSFVRTGVALNPGFEESCGSLPCEWSASGSAAITRQTVNPHSGSASMQMLRVGTGGNVVNTCLANVSPGQYSLSFFYRTTSANVASVAASVAFFSTDTCANAVGSVVTNDSSPDLSGAWSQTSSFGEAPASARSMQLTVDFICTNGCAGTPVVNYDDVSVGSQAGMPTAVKLVSLRARRAAQGVALEWRAKAE